MITLVIVRLGFGKSHDKEFRYRTLAIKRGCIFIITSNKFRFLNSCMSKKAIPHTNDALTAILSGDDELKKARVNRLIRAGFFHLDPIDDPKKEVKEKKKNVKKPKTNP